MSSSPSRVSQLLTASRCGQGGSTDELMVLVYHELRQIAARHLQQQPWHTLQPTALVHEAYMRLMGQASSPPGGGAGGDSGGDSTGDSGGDSGEECRLEACTTGDSGGCWNDRQHFMAVASIAIRQILINHAESRSARKRGGNRDRMSLNDLDAVFERDSLDLLAINEAMKRLEALSPRQARVVELRVFGGLTVTAAAAVLEVSPSTVKTDWSVARAWLKSELRAQ